MTNDSHLNKLAAIFRAKNPPKCARIRSGARVEWFMHEIKYFLSGRDLLHRFIKFAIVYRRLIYT